MKLLYIFLDSTRSSGVVNKVRKKITFLNDSGIETVGIFLNRHIQEARFDKQERIVYVPFPAPEPASIFNRRFFRNYKWYFALRKNAKQQFGLLQKEMSRHDPDLILFRYPLSGPFLLKLVKRYPGRIVFEHNTKEPEELAGRAGAGKGAAFLHRQEIKYGPRVLEKAAGIIGVTDEIRDYELFRCNNRVKHSATISNAIDFSSVPLRTPPVFDGSSLHLLFLCGSDVPWHGEDRLIKGMQAYTGPVNIKLFLLGNVPSSSKKLVNDLHMHSQGIFVNEVRGAELESYFERVHLGVGTLALHRKNLTEAASLKVRDYAARGLPFMLAYHDKDVEQNEGLLPFRLRLEEGEEPVHMETVIDFVRRIQAIPGAASQMRNAARATMDIGVKMGALRNFLIQVNDSKK
ncbi:MAG TPA: hypothetical protein VI112_14590 [Bacteroidia bacterium]